MQDQPRRDRGNPKIDEASAALGDVWLCAYQSLDYDLGLENPATCSPEARLEAARRLVRMREFERLAALEVVEAESAVRRTEDGSSRKQAREATERLRTATLVRERASERRAYAQEVFDRLVPEREQRRFFPFGR